MDEADNDDDETLAELKKIVIAQRADSKKNPRTILDALRRYSIWGDQSPHLVKITDAEIEKKTVDELYNDAVKPLLSRTLRWIDPIQPAEPLRTDRLRLFLVTDLPETFQVRQPHRTGHAGRAMFVLEAVAPVRAEISDASPAALTRPRRDPDLAATTQQGRTR